MEDNALQDLLLIYWLITETSLLGCNNQNLHNTRYGIANTQLTSLGTTDSGERLPTSGHHLKHCYCRGESQSILGSHNFNHNLW